MICDVNLGFILLTHFPPGRHFLQDFAFVFELRSARLELPL